MPKIIDNARELILAEARRLALSDSYEGLTMRAVASACGMSVGTVYNYFDSKETLTASFMLEDWERIASAAETDTALCADASQALFRIYSALGEFLEIYRPLFASTGAEKVYSVGVKSYHALIISRLSAMFAPFSVGAPDPAFLASFAAEALVTWTMRGADFADMEPLFKRLFAQ